MGETQSDRLTMRLISQILFLLGLISSFGTTSRNGRILDEMFSNVLGLCSQGGRCPGTERGVIISPNHPQNYPVKMDINYTIETLQGSLIELTFEDFDLEPGRTSGRGGCYDSLRIIDSDGEILGTHCETADIKPFNTTSNLLTLIFSSDESITRSGFRASWRRIEMTETSGKITSPGYPILQSGTYLERVAVLNAPKGSRFQLTFIDIDLDTTFCSRFQTIYLFDGLPNSGMMYSGEFITTIDGGNILTNQDNLKHTSRTNVVSVWFDQYDFSSYYYYYYDDDCDLVECGEKRGFRLDWKI